MFLQLQNAPQKYYRSSSFFKSIKSSFAFFFRHFKIIIRFFAVLLLPICFIQALNLSGLMIGAYRIDKQCVINPYSLADFFTVNKIINFSIYFFLFIFAYVLLCAFIFTLSNYAYSYKERDTPFTLQEISYSIVNKINRVIISALIIFACNLFMGGVVYLLARLSYYSLIATLPITFLLNFMLFLFPIIYTQERKSFKQSLIKMVKMGCATLGNLFFLSLVMGILALIIIVAISFPFNFGVIMKSLIRTHLSFVSYEAMLFIFAILKILGIYVAMVLVILSSMYHYFFSTKEYKASIN